MLESRDRNNDNGAHAYDPAILLKIVLFACSCGITSSRKMVQACRENVMFTALSADTSEDTHHDENVVSEDWLRSAHLNG